MAKRKSSGSGLMSSAGLVNNYESSKDAIKLQPKMVMIVGASIGAFLFIANHLWVV